MFIIVESFKTSPLYNTLIYVILTDMPHRFWTLCMHLNVSAILQQQRIDWKYASTHVVVLKYWPVCRSIKHTINGSNIILCIIHIEWANAIRINVNSINLLQSLTYLKGFKYFFSFNTRQGTCAVKDISWVKCSFSTILTFRFETFTLKGHGFII